MNKGVAQPAWPPSSTVESVSVAEPDTTTRLQPAVERSTRSATSTPVPSTTTSVNESPPWICRSDSVVVSSPTSSTNPSPLVVAVRIVAAGPAPAMVTDLVSAPGRSSPSKVPAPTWTVPSLATAKIAAGTVAQGLANEQSGLSTPPLAGVTT